MYRCILQDFEGVSVEYITVPGWKSSIAKCNTYEALPENARKYVETIEKFLSIPGMFESHFKNVLLILKCGVKRRQLYFCTAFSISAFSPRFYFLSLQ